MKKIMVLGAGRGQISLYKAARGMGVKSIAATISGDYPGTSLADEIEYVDITDKEGILNVAEKHGIDGIVSACIDIPVPTIGYVCDKLGLKGISYDAAVTCTNKLLMKKAFERNGVRTARFVKIELQDNVIECSSHLKYPLIVKPVDLAGSKGINIVFKKEELCDAVLNTMSDTKEDYCIIEEYIDGYEFSATAMVVDGEILFILPTGDVRYGENDEIPVGHYLPYEDSPEVIADTFVQIERGIRALNLNNCAVNADLMRKDGEVYILEMTGRLGANCIPELTSIYTGYDINKAIIEIALGEKSLVEVYNEAQMPKKSCYAQMLVSGASGLLKNIGISDEANELANVLLFSNIGDNVNKFTTTNDCIGQVVAYGKDLGDARNKAIRATKLIDLVID